MIRFGSLLLSILISTLHFKNELVTVKQKEMKISSGFIF